jgi:DNA-binding IclR family transcriptional regulator
MDEVALAANEASSGVAVLDRAFGLLAAFGPDDNQLTLTELSRRAGLYKSTALRILGALEHGGFVRKLEDGQYAIGPEPLRLATIYQRSFRVGPVIEPLLKSLSAASGETASFYVRNGDKRVALFRVEPNRTVRAAVAVGQEYSMRVGAASKVLLAFGPQPPTEHQKVRERLWAASYGERDPDTASVAAPVFGPQGQLQGAIALSGPMTRIGQPEAALHATELVLEAASEASQALGGATHDFGDAARRLALADFGASGS